MRKRNWSITNCMFILFGFQFLSLCTAAVPLNNKVPMGVSVTNAVVYVPLVSNHTTTAFFTLQNNSAHPISITKITSRAVKKIVLIPAIPMKVDAVNPWLVPAHQKLVLNPAKQYLQLTGLKNSLSTGDELQLDVSLSDGKKLLLIAKARSAFDQIHGH